MEEKIKELEKQIAELRAELKKEIEFRVNKGDDYYYISEYGAIGRFPEANDSTDDSLYEIGNYFKTEEEAKTMVKKLKAIAKVSRAILIANDGWKPDWSNYSNKYFFYYSYATGIWINDSGSVVIGDSFRYEIKMILPYIKTAEIAEQIREDYEEELRTILE